MPQTQTRDWVTPLAVIGGGLALVTGVFLIFRKKGQVEVGDTLLATFHFDYFGPQEVYIFRVTMGYLGWTGIDFYENETTRRGYESLLPPCIDWQRQEIVVEYEIPLAGPSDTDIEFSIRYSTEDIVPGMRVIARNAVER